MADDNKESLRKFWPRFVALLVIVGGVYLIEFAIIGATIPVSDHPHRAIAYAIAGVLNGFVIAFGAIIAAGKLSIVRR